MIAEGVQDATQSTQDFDGAQTLSWEFVFAERFLAQEQRGPQAQQRPLQFGEDVLRGQAAELAALGGLFHGAEEDFDAPALAIDRPDFFVLDLQIVRD